MGFRQMVDYVNLIKGTQCLQIDFFWNFVRFRTEQEETKEAEMLVEALLSPVGFKKLTIGADGSQSSYLPVKFMETFIRGLGESEIKIQELCIDLHYLNNLVVGSP